MEFIIAALMFFIGIGIIVFWFLHWRAGRLTEGLSTVDSGNYVAFHIAAELITAVLAITAGALILSHGLPSARPWIFLAAGALIYTSVNSMGWSVKNDRRLTPVFVITFITALWVAWYAQYGWLNFG
ncbi:MAG: hypothetical protein ACRKGH_05010 [Dehalogenimonas sp.]